MSRAGVVRLAGQRSVEILDDDRNSGERLLLRTNRSRLLERMAEARMDDGIHRLVGGLHRIYGGGDQLDR